MGGSFGSVSLWDADEGAVREACEAQHRQTKTQFLIAPPRSGWVTVYPSDHGQDVSVGEALARVVGRPALHLGVHDGATLFWFYYDATGALQDRYVANDTIGLSDPFEPEQLRGCPEVFLNQLGPIGVARLRTLIASPDEEDPAWAIATLEAIGSVFGLPPLLTSFEDGQEDRRAVPSGSVQVPSPTSPKATLAKLKADRLLLASLKGPRATRSVQLSSLRSGELGLAWLSPPGGTVFERWTSPWRRPKSRIALPGHSLSVLAMSASGQHLAIVGAVGEKAAATLLYDLATPLEPIELPLANAGVFLEGGASLLLHQPSRFPRPPGPVPPGATDGPKLLRFSLRGVLEEEWSVPVYLHRIALDARGRVAISADDLFVQDLEHGWRNWLSLAELPRSPIADALSSLAGLGMAGPVWERMSALFIDPVRDRLVTCGERALRVYDWERAKPIPPDPPSFELPNPKGTTALSIDPGDGALLACSDDSGSLARLDLEGQTREDLLELPGLTIVGALVHNEVLVTVATKQRSRRDPRVDVWDYAALRGRAARKSWLPR